jgi:hypothetical protein
MYGDIAAALTDEDAEAAELMSASLRRRLAQAQPLQVRAVAVISKGSLLKPFTDEVPGVTLPSPFASLATRRAQRAAARRRQRMAKRALRAAGARRATPKLRTKATS